MNLDDLGLNLSALKPVSRQLDMLLATGGPVMLVLAGLSVIALAIILLKAAHFAWLGLGQRRFIDGALSAWNAGDARGAFATLAHTRNPIARVMERAMRGARDRALSRHDLEEDVARDGAVRINGLRSHLRLLELIATLSPLLGLLGTVLGMIDAFQALEAAGNRVNPAILSGGIWVALLTTAAGLIVAIPAAAAHNIFDGMVERAGLAMEDAATRIVIGDGPGKRRPVGPTHDRPEIAAKVA